MEARERARKAGKPFRGRYDLPEKAGFSHRHGIKMAKPNALSKARAAVSVEKVDSVLRLFECLLDPTRAR